MERALSCDSRAAGGSPFRPHSSPKARRLDWKCVTKRHGNHRRPMGIALGIAEGDIPGALLREANGAVTRSQDLEPDLIQVDDFLKSFQDHVCTALENVDGVARFRREEILRGSDGLSRPHVLEDGPVVERAAVNFSHTRGNQLPAAATERRPELAGGHYEAVSTSLIVHPRNPYAPTSHANFRFFLASKPGVEAIWWFGGGFDLTPYYGFDEDALHWHRVAQAACAPFGAGGITDEPNFDLMAFASKVTIAFWIALRGVPSIRAGSPPPGEGPRSR